MSVILNERAENLRAIELSIGNSAGITSPGTNALNEFLKANPNIIIKQIQYSTCGTKTFTHRYALVIYSEK